MLRALAHYPDGRPLVILGIAAENWRRLQMDQPIKVNLRNFGADGKLVDELPDIDIIISFDDGHLAAKLGGFTDQVPQPGSPIWIRQVGHDGE